MRQSNNIKYEGAKQLTHFIREERLRKFYNSFVKAIVYVFLWFPAATLGINDKHIYLFSKVAVDMSHLRRLSYSFRAYSVELIGFMS